MRLETHRGICGNMPITRYEQGCIHRGVWGRGGGGPGVGVSTTQLGAPGSIRGYEFNNNLSSCFTLAQNETKNPISTQKHPYGSLQHYQLIVLPYLEWNLKNHGEVWRTYLVSCPTIIPKRYLNILG